MRVVAPIPREANESFVAPLCAVSLLARLYQRLRETQSPVKRKNTQLVPR